jgi:hypothetical protein
MTVALMLMIAAGVAAWVLAPLRAPAPDAATDPLPARPASGRDPGATQDGGDT